MRLAAALLLLLALPLAAAPQDMPPPRTLSEAERAAVATMTHYLAGGPAAVWNDLAAQSPLRALGQSVAFREIEVRLGPPGDAVWQLDTVLPAVAERSAAFSVSFPSGIDDAVLFEMVREGNAWRLQNLRTLAEPVTRPSLLTPLAHAKASAVDAEPLPEPLRDRRLPSSLVLPAALLSVGAVAVGRRSRWTARVLLILAALPIIGATALVAFPAIHERFLTRPAQAAPKQKPDAATTSTFTRLGDLVELRNAVVRGDASSTLLTSVPAGPARDAAMLWQAQLLMQQERMAEVKRLLKRFPQPSSVPMAELLRARLAYFESDAVGAVIAYEHAIDLGPGRDALWLEVADVLSTLGFDDRSERYTRRVSELGSRRPELVYSMAVLAAIDDQDERSEKYLRSAWKMQPIERGNLIGVQLLWRVLRRPQIMRMLQLYNADEVSFASPATHAIEVPEGVGSVVSGDFLRIAAGGAELHVPGGASIAPIATAAIDAGAWRREQTNDALADYETLRNDIRSAAALTQPALRARCIRTAFALATRNRWNDLATLTEPLSPRDERIPLRLTILRAEALFRLGKLDAMRGVVLELLRNPGFKRKKDPVVMVEIAELLVQMEETASAIRLLERAGTDSELPGIAFRIQQLTLEQRLKADFQSHKSEHFEIRYPPEVSDRGPAKMAEILEAELRRLRAAWFPRTNFRRIVVEVLWWEDFASYTGSEFVAGLYTNRIFLPLASVETFPPEIVSLITHELTHAMLADATNNLAPRWFHEAFASRMEMHDTYRNAFQIYRDEQFLTLALLDAVANGSPDPEMIVEAYRIGETTLRFIETKHGKRAVERMIDAFRRGADTEEAIREATGGSLADLDRAARAWGATQPGTFAGGPVIRYDGVTPETRRGTITFGGARRRR
jgi:hypothetical protein